MAAYGCLGLALLVVANWGYQMLRKPSELLALAGSPVPKTSRGTWQAYGRLFRAHSTDIIPSELLGALAQVETHGDPLARTYWRWRWSWNPFELYAPASSAVGILQITDAAFEEAKRYCIHDHKVVKAGPWHDLKSCWFNSLYARPIPSHAIEMTAARLHQIVVTTLAEERITRATRDQQQSLAAVVHLCGTQRGVAYARRGFRLAPGERCGAHSASAYLARVQSLTRQFARLDPDLPTQ
ncbi:MAG: lytic transglycosylase domain-containing protein [Candidatus Rokuibacteriota bacterium]